MELPPRDVNPPAEAYNDPLEVDRTLGLVLLYGVLPAWLVPGFVDYLYHRKTAIERTSGMHESLIHAAQMIVAGVPTLMGLVLEIDAPVVGSMIGLTLLHELLTLWDVAYAEPLRRPPPGEQHVHSFLEVMPFMALGAVLALHPRPTAEFFRSWGKRPRWRPRLKRPALSRRYVAGLLLVIGGAMVVPYAEELVRCYRVDHSFGPHRPPPQPPADA